MNPVDRINSGAIVAQDECDQWSVYVANTCIATFRGRLARLAATGLAKLLRATIKSYCETYQETAED